MTELPTGTVTFLFSDIEGSTRLLNETGDAWPQILERHRGIVRSAIAAQQGTEVGTEGDSFFVVFPSASAAVSAAVAMQRGLAAEPWPQQVELRVRIGLHTGEGRLAADSYVGLDVHRAARIAAAGHGGQVLLSDAARALTDHELPAGVTLRDLGEHRLKDLPSPERLWQLVIEDLPSDFPVLGTLSATPNNLPTRLTTFLGREREIAAVSALLVESRLLTLTGPGGTGKTRLSLEVASRTISRHPDGVFFIELAPISEPELVLSTIAQQLGLPDRGGRSAADRIVDHIGDGRVLLVLDNFEQVVEAGGAVADLLRRAPNLTVLLSSRAALRVSGEREFPVPPLGLPEPGAPRTPEALSQYEAVALFVERAAAVKPDFAVTNENAPAVAEICWRLDGLPLAIELAAARIRILSPQAMLARLENRLTFLASGARDLPARQQTLRGAIAWSYDLLSEQDRALFACLAVFVGGASLDAVERVCGDAVEAEILDGLGSLVDKSLVRQWEGLDAEPRFGMLETIREFALEAAAEAGHLVAARRRHAEVYADLAEAAAEHLLGSDKRAWLDRLEQDHDNVRAAVSWSIESHEPELALRLTASLWRFWQMRGYLAEGLERAQAALALEHGDELLPLRARALDAAAGLAYWQADRRARAFYEQEIELLKRLGDRRGLAEALYSISFTYSLPMQDEPESPTRAREIVREALAIFEEIGDEPGTARCLWALANASYSEQLIGEATDYATRALEIFRHLDDAFMVGWTVYTLALIDLVKFGRDGSGDLARAGGLLSEALSIFADAQDVTGYVLVVDAIAATTLWRGDRACAARLLGAVQNLERVTGTGLNLANRELFGFDPEELLRDPSVAQEIAAGERLPVPEAIRVAMEAATAG